MESRIFQGGGVIPQTGAWLVQPCDRPVIRQWQQTRISSKRRRLSDCSSVSDCHSLRLTATDTHISRTPRRRRQQDSLKTDCFIHYFSCSHFFLYAFLVIVVCSKSDSTWEYYLRHLMMYLQIARLAPVWHHSVPLTAAPCTRHVLLSKIALFSLVSK